MVRELTGAQVTVGAPGRHLNQTGRAKAAVSPSLGQETLKMSFERYTGVTEEQNFHMWRELTGRGIRGVNITLGQRTERLVGVEVGTNRQIPKA